MGIYLNGDYVLKKLLKTFKFVFIALVFLLLITPCCFLTIATTDNYSCHSLPETNYSWFWSNYEILSDTSTGWSYAPKIAIDSEDNIHVVWYDTTADLLGSGADSDIFYMFYDSTTENWSSKELVSSESTSSSDFPVIAVDTNGDVHVAWEDSTDYLGAGTDKDVFHKRKNAGGSWTITSVVSTDSTQAIDDVAIDTDHKDNVYVLWTDSTDIGGAGIDNDIFFRTYNSTSSAWTSTALVSTESSDSSYDPDIAVDSLSGDAHLVWEDYTNLLGSGTDGDIFYRKLNIFSSSWSELEIVSAESTANSYDPKLESDQNGDVHVVWDDLTEYSGEGSDLDIFYKKLDSTLDSWGITEVVSTESTSSSTHPNPIIDRNGFVFVAWYDSTDIDGVGSDFDIFFKFKDSFSNQWSLTDVVSPESTDISIQPELAVDSFGFISCVWTDQTDLGGSGIDPDVYYRKLAGTPPTPILLPIVPNPSTSENISLNWKQIQSAEDYLVYRSNSYIWSIYDIEPLEIVTEDSYIDTLNETGVYYYVVCARNEYGSSVISNVEYVEIIEDAETGLFASLDLVEILVLAGIVLGLQIIVSVITYSLVKRSMQTKSRPTKSKK